MNKGFQVDWNEFKKFIDDRKLSIQWIDWRGSYWLKASDGFFILECVIKKVDPVPGESDQEDFETNYKTDGNKLVKEKATLKMAKAKAAASDGVATILLKVPGIIGSGDGRVVEGGEGWFETSDEDDRVEVHITDEDNILGLGSGATIDSYTDTDVPTGNQGWYIQANKKSVSVTKIADAGFVPAGLYLKIIGTKVSTQSNDTFRCNILWGKR